MFLLSLCIIKNTFGINFKPLEFTKQQDNFMAFYILYKLQNTLRTIEQIYNERKVYYYREQN